MAVVPIHEFRRLDCTDRLRLPAAGTEAASRGCSLRARDVAREDDPAAFSFYHRIRLRYGRQQGLRVRMAGVSVDLVPVSGLDDLSQIHHRYDMGDLPHHGQIVSDEEVGDSKSGLDVLEQVDDLCLDRYVERRNGFIGDYELRFQRESPGDPYALPLTAGTHGPRAAPDAGFGSTLATVAPEVLSPMRCTPEMIRTLHAYSVARGVPLFMHVGAARDEMDESVRRYGMTTVEFLESLGVLGPRTVLAHANYITNEENGLLARYGTGVAHCPVANIWAGGRIPMLAEWVAAGVRVGLGTDGATSNNGQDLWETAKMAVLLQKTRLADRTYASAELGLELLTIGGARALHMEDRIGSLEPGKQADVICIDIDRPALTPRATVTSNLVYSHDRAAVRHVYVGGVEQLRDGEPVNLDVGAVAGLVEEQAGRVLSAPGVGQGFAERSRMRWADRNLSLEGERQRAM